MLNLYQKLCQIQSQTGQISKSELNKFQNYKYFTEQQALNILKPLLAEQKLTLTFSDVFEPAKEWNSGGELKKQKTEKDWVVSYPKQAILTNSEDPKEQLTFNFWAIGSNSDPAKAKGCAETYAIKYFLTKFFLIPTTDELDPDVTKSHEYLNRLKNGQQETPEQIQKRHQERDQKREAELKAKYGADWKLSNEYKLWKGGNHA
ncbi:MAG: single-stranded DNA-binding protein [Mycoplasmataceae bacterium CE_OT135]|nr:MAG: single-stranded DNA-binding protein [Mycoplasmataceae bacterium CE_OT135]